MQRKSSGPYLVSDGLAPILPCPFISSSSSSSSSGCELSLLGKTTTVDPEGETGEESSMAAALGCSRRRGFCSAGLLLLPLLDLAAVERCEAWRELRLERRVPAKREDTRTVLYLTSRGKKLR